MIFVHRNTITGLTTAAGIWATSGVGMAIGAGLYSIGICATVLILFAQIILHKNFRWIRLPKAKVLVIKGVNEENFQESITNKLKELSISIRDVSIDSDEDNNRKYTFHIEIPYDVTEESVVSVLPYQVSLKSGS